MNPSKCFALLFLSALAFAVEGKITVGTPVAVNVDSDPNVAVPIEYSSGSYVGPYDPIDPKGLIAAQHRNEKIAREKAFKTVKSYVPPGVGKFVKKEGMKVAVKEGERFALKHPLETADLVGIVGKAKHLYKMGASKVKKANKS